MITLEKFSIGCKSIILSGCHFYKVTKSLSHFSEKLQLSTKKIKNMSRNSLIDRSALLPNFA